MAKNTEKPALSFEASFKQTRAKYGSNTIMLASEMNNVTRIPIGIPGLDFKLCGGLPMGRIIHICGGAHAGKTLIAKMVAAALQKHYGDKMVFWLDVERSFDPVRAEQVGVDLNRVIVCRPASSEAGLNELIEMAPFVSGAVVDSVAALSTIAETEATMADKQVGAVAALMSKFFHKWISDTSSEKLKGEAPMLLLTNQLRDDIGSYIKKTKTPGGRCMLHYPSVFIEVSRGPVVRLKETDAEDEEVAVGHDIKFKIVKNNTFQPDQVGSFMLCTRPTIIGDGGYRLLANQIDWPKDLLKYAVHHEIVKKGGSWHEFPNGEKIQGKVESQVYLYNNTDVAGELQQLIMKEIRKIHGLKELGDTQKVEKSREASSKKPWRKAKS